MFLLELEKYKKSLILDVELELLRWAGLMPKNEEMSDRWLGDKFCYLQRKSAEQKKNKELLSVLLLLFWLKSLFNAISEWWCPLHCWLFYFTSSISQNGKIKIDIRRTSQRRDLKTLFYAQSTQLCSPPQFPLYQIRFFSLFNTTLISNCITALKFHQAQRFFLGNLEKSVKNVNFWSRLDYTWNWVESGAAHVFVRWPKFF